ncbi:site-specific integrase [Prevotella sp. P6B1]|uniref:site-specific integrase n=1 Tax=Prevotella sp. P6B1 TaxID=1410613 RepID=UPI00051B542B|nr:site-specific integrase [Prevotella sp. P6B1]
MKKNVKVVFDRRKTAAKTGKGSIDICVYLREGERKFVSAGTATPEDWESVAMERGVFAKVKYYENVIHAMQTLGEEMTIATFNKHVFAEQISEREESDNKNLFNGNDQRQSIIEYIEDSLNREDLRSGSRRNIVVVIASLKKFKKIKTFYDLTPTKIIEYDKWLHSQGDKSLATIYNYHKKLHKYTRQLWRNEMIPSDPYNHVEIKHGTYKERQPLNEEELLILREAKDLSPRLDRVRDLFIFMAYTGLAYVDMCNFKFKAMTEKEGSTYFIDGARVKTGSNFFTPILPPAMDVLEKYHFSLPIISNTKLNDYLHVIQEKLGFKKPLTCHVARHSFATLLLTYQFPIERVARALGHKDVRITQIYAKILKKPMVEQTEQLVASIK